MKVWRTAGCLFLFFNGLICKLFVYICSKWADFGINKATIGFSWLIFAAGLWHGGRKPAMRLYINPPESASMNMMFIERA